MVPLKLLSYKIVMHGAHLSAHSLRPGHTAPKEAQPSSWDPIGALVPPCLKDISLKYSFTIWGRHILQLETPAEVCSSLGLFFSFA